MSWLYRIGSATFLASVVAGCATVKHYETVKEPLAQELTAGVGDVVLRIDRERDLENNVGKADLFGRRTREGFSEVRYLGVEHDGTLVFARKDLEIQTDETTVTRMGAIPVNTRSSVNLSGTVGNAGFSATGTANGTTWVPTRAANTMAIPSDSVAIRIAPGQARIVRVGEYVLAVHNASASGVTYEVEHRN